MLTPQTTFWPWQWQNLQTKSQIADRTIVPIMFLEEAAQLSSKRRMTAMSLGSRVWIRNEGLVETR
jgi:hypothetical protein